MYQTQPKYKQKNTLFIVSTSTGKTCSPLLSYRKAYRTNSCGNAIANSLGLLHAETGFSYFGARYYDSDILTGWLSVDPMADKYPGLSPYAYCAWNPVKLVDPDGEEIAFAGNEEKEAYYQYRKIVFSNKRYDHIQKEIINLESAKEIFRIRLNGNVSNEKGGGNFVYNKETNEFDINIIDNGSFSIIEKLSHELKHADQYLNRKLTLIVSTSGYSSFYCNSDSYSINDELEAYEQQGMFGNTLTKEEVFKKYRETGASWYDQNKQYKPSNDVIQTNILYQEHFGYPRILYHGWENDINNSQRKK